MSLVGWYMSQEEKVMDDDEEEEGCMQSLGLRKGTSEKVVAANRLKTIVLSNSLQNFNFIKII